MDTNHYIIDLDAELCIPWRSFVNIIYIVPSLCLKAPYYLFFHTSNGIKVYSPSDFFHTLFRVTNAVWTGWEINRYFSFVIFLICSLFY